MKQLLLLQAELCLCNLLKVKVKQFPPKDGHYCRNKLLKDGIKMTNKPMNMNNKLTHYLKLNKREDLYIPSKPQKDGYKMKNRLEVCKLEAFLYSIQVKTRHKLLIHQLDKKTNNKDGLTMTTKNRNKKRISRLGLCNPKRLRNQKKIKLIHKEQQFILKTLKSLKKSLKYQSNLSNSKKINYKFDDS